MKPKREHATNNAQTYMTTAVTEHRIYHFRPVRWCQLFIGVLYKYRDAGSYALHEFVVMRDHVHILLSPTIALESAMKLIKGGFSYEAGVRFRHKGPLWQPGFEDERVRTPEQYASFVEYIHHNPVRARIVQRPEQFPFSSAYPGFALDPAPERLRLKTLADLQLGINGTTEAVSSQSKDSQADETEFAQNADSLTASEHLFTVKKVGV